MLILKRLLLRECLFAKTFFNDISKNYYSLKHEQILTQKTSNQRIADYFGITISVVDLY